MHGPSHNDARNLANSILVFSMSKLTESKKCINLYTKPVSNLKAEYLCEMLLYYLDKDTEYNYEIIPIIMVRASVNTKMAKNLLYQLNIETEGNKVCIGEIKLCTSFICHEKIYFVLFYIIYIIKNIRNTLIRKGNEFHYPKLVLSTSFILESGICSVY